MGKITLIEGARRCIINLKKFQMNSPLIKGDSGGCYNDFVIPAQRLCRNYGSAYYVILNLFQNLVFSICYRLLRS